LPTVDPIPPPVPAPRRGGLALPAAALLALGLLLHLPALERPREVVFDEVYFGQYVTAYCCTGERFFDIHPPHAKLLLAGSAWAAGFRGGHGEWAIGKPYGARVPVWALRLLPNLVGALIPLLALLVLLQLGASRPAALLAGLALALDNALLIQTRYLLLDGLLLAATLGALACFLRAARELGPRRLAWDLATGALAGLAIGTKVTGLAALALPLLLLAAPVLGLPLARETPAPGEPRRRARVFRALGRAAVLLAAAAAVYLLGWALHFERLPHPGPGDAFNVPTGHFVTDLVAANREMLAANLRIRASHPDAHPWWGWPLLRAPVAFWRQGDLSLQLFGNPAVWWGSGLLLLALAGDVLRAGHRARKALPRQPGDPSPPDPALAVPLAGYLLSYLPLAAVQRPLFLYHYLTPLVFAVIAGALWLDGRLRAGAVRWRVRWGTMGGIALLMAGFLLASPVTYGFEAPFGLQRDLLGWIRSFHP
jgi:dolichyl-phosphate-mannose-protein mannosyltransferase